MINDEKLYIILDNILSRYETITELSKISGIDRGYLSRFINKKLPSPPSPKILKKLANASKGVTTYEELMQLCGYINIETTFAKVKNSLSHVEDKFLTIPVFMSKNARLIKTNQDILLPISWDHFHSYLAYVSNDDSMAPLLNIDDIAIIEKQEINEFENGKTYLLELENKILIRKIIDTGNSLELQAMNPYYQSIKTTKHKIKIIGKVVKAENQSAFK